MDKPLNAAAEAMAARINEYLHRRSGVSLVELARDIQGFAGDLTWGNPEHNVIIWRNMSQESLDAIQSLISDGSIIAKPSHYLVYAYDGVTLDLPIATSVKKKYARLHWLPSEFAGARRTA